MVTVLIDEQRVLSSCCPQNECGTGEGRSVRCGFQGLQQSLQSVSGPCSQWLLQIAGECEKGCPL